jgi:2,3,4,5-tetrahydropyridine-2-carboxylate N-succinyltransferase
MTKPDLASLERAIDKAFDDRDSISTSTLGETRDAVETALDLLARVWRVSPSASRMDSGRSTNG